MNLHTGIVYTNNLDPWRNLAVEEYLLDHMDENQIILYLWQNQNTVVIGKNQNAWRECRTELLEKEKGKLARRLSGGGAVFHDIGNLNFTFVVNRDFYDLSRQLEVVLTAVRKVGIGAQFTGRNDLVVDGRKFSGNAFCFRKASGLHHGTILISADMDKLTRYLQVSGEKIRSKGIESVQSRVINLREYKASLTIDEMMESLMISYREIYGGKPTLLHGEEGMDQAVLSKLYEKYASWQWRYGESPKFDLDMDTRFPWGMVEIGMNLRNGIIEETRIYSDAMDGAFIEMLPQALQACPLQSSAMAQRILALEVPEEKRPMLEDISKWLNHKGF